MKKLISLVLTIAMLASMAVVNVSSADWSLPEGAAAEPTIRFGLLADSHISSANLAYTSGIMQKAATAFNNMGVDALVLAGDIVMHQNTDTRLIK